MGLHRGFNEIEVNNGGGGMYGAYPMPMYQPQQHVGLAAATGAFFGSVIGDRRGGFYGGGCGDGYGRLENIQDSIYNQNILNQFNNTNEVARDGFRDQLIAVFGTNQKIDELRHDNCKQTYELSNKMECEANRVIAHIEDAERRREDRAYLDRAISDGFNSRGQFPGSGPVITAHPVSTQHDHDIVLKAMMLNNMNNNMYAVNTGTNVNTGAQGMVSRQELI